MVLWFDVALTFWLVWLLYSIWVWGLVAAVGGCGLMVCVVGVGTGVLG